MCIAGRKTFTFLITILFITLNTVSVFYLFTENALAEDITHAECTSTLTVGIGTKDTDDNGDAISDIAQVTITNSKSIQILRFNFIHRLINSWSRLARLLSLPIFNKLLVLQ